jgi:precorrin-6B methylase 2
MSLRVGGGSLQITLQKYMKIHRYKLITNYITLRNITKIITWKYNDKKGTLQITLITLHKIYKIHSKNTITKLNTQYATNYNMD